jgi:hypothetical protein
VTALTTSQLIASATQVLEAGGYLAVSPPEDWQEKSSRLFEDVYGIVCVVGYDTWGELASTWQDAQGRFVDLISEHLARPEPKAWEGYLVLLTPGIEPRDARSQIAEIRYDTNRVRKIVATGDELQTLDDVEDVLLPLLPLSVSGQNGGGAALLDRLPELLSTRGIEVPVAKVVVEAFVANQSMLERLHDFTKTA